MTIYRREVQPFSASQVALSRHFAAQAVIAIENVRLFEQARSALRNSSWTGEVRQLRQIN
jgi:GAF domain-containing protein